MIFGLCQKVAYVLPNIMKLRLEKILVADELQHLFCRLFCRLYFPLIVPGDRVYSAWDHDV